MCPKTSRVTILRVIASIDLYVCVWDINSSTKGDNYEMDSCLNFIYLSDSSEPIQMRHLRNYEIGWNDIKCLRVIYYGILYSEWTSSLWIPRMFFFRLAPLPYHSPHRPLTKISFSSLGYPPSSIVFSHHRLSVAFATLPIFAITRFFILSLFILCYICYYSRLLNFRSGL